MEHQVNKEHEEKTRSGIATRTSKAGHLNLNENVGNRDNPTGTLGIQMHVNAFLTQHEE